jgi:hypothetical protein
MLLPQLYKSQDVYKYGFGLAEKWLSLNLQANILGFIDTDDKKVGRTFNQYKVYSIDHAKKSNQQLIYLTKDYQSTSPAFSHTIKMWFSVKCQVISISFKVITNTCFFRI